MVKKGEVKFDPTGWSDVSSTAIEFTKLMLTYDPKARRGLGHFLSMRKRLM